ncbi:hypothetical protein GNI_124380 [Gregarina niphandrodes]|uniref:Uncharacterized protein n=1 Tax=Gregarina niphandrodes TaxID=110365 RepID=A0A023B272_GRENI|nr:hypothetical protein GNI_124380 [Gregarina niphandrodes]EZG51529.1 hypothetical protein GNI_124380 [Gregarina niphandrodes]|eukprot:XP_011131967.1 hypothetical protein GNI_124380 [Gregarina niphandrodes]
MSDDQEMTVNVTTVPKQDKAPKYMYPYKPLTTQATTYRGYPVKGSKAFKGAWKVQIVSPQCRSPPEPLPQFPQQEILKRNIRGNYEGAGSMKLSPSETANNSGEAYLPVGQESPSSEFFYTAGYETNSAIKLKKQVQGSIYRSFVAGQPVPVKILKDDEDEKKQQQ